MRRTAPLVSSYACDGVNDQMPTDAGRVLRENLKSSYARVGTAIGVALAWLGPYKAADYLGVTDRRDKILIVIAFYVVAGIALVITFLIRSLRWAYAKIGPDDPTEKALSKLAAKFLGVEKELFVSEVCILADGSSSSVNDVTLVAHAKQITKVEYLSSTPSLPEDVQGKYEVSAEPHHQSGVKIIPEVLRSTARECFWSINFIPDLRQGTRVHYRFRTKSLPKTFAKTTEELKQRDMEKEHYSQLVTYPTARLRLHVSYDREVEPQNIHYDVWLGRGGVQHVAEYIRISQNNFFSTGVDEDGRMYGELDVHYPIHGLRYVLTWKPPKAKG